MAATTTRLNNVAELFELLHRLGDVPAERVLMNPAPGRATEKHLAARHRRSAVGCELVDGTLVEKTVGYRESLLASWIGYLLYEFAGNHDLGEVSGEQGYLKLYTGVVRSPDVTFIRKDWFPEGGIPDDAYPSLTPCLAVEVLSKSNTSGEMARKRRDYFLSGTDLVWQVDPVTHEVEVFTRPEFGTVFREGDTLDGGNVLPGLALPVVRLFARLPARET